ncbi:hypothetical protein [Marinactinospora rubrisoli]|uniref:Uncharacterized protein n=1 Tax=Marinactinospora rubrisoli TaxID=2715399 RepID=A0ABW2KNJ5_9ACTN
MSTYSVPAPAGVSEREWFLLNLMDVLESDALAYGWDVQHVCWKVKGRGPRNMIVCEPPTDHAAQREGERVFAHFRRVGGREGVHLPSHIAVAGEDLEVSTEEEIVQAFARLRAWFARWPRVVAEPLSVPEMITTGEVQWISVDHPLPGVVQINDYRSGGRPLPDRTTPPIEAADEVARQTIPKETP